MHHALFFAMALMTAELILGTNPLFAVCVFLYVLITAVAFNVAGGLYTFSGSYIAFQSLQSILISQIGKIFYLQAADSNLHSPLTTVAVYTAGELALAGACLFTRRYRRRIPIMDSRTDAKFTMAMSMTASVIGIVTAFLVGTIGSDVYGNVEGGSIWSYIGQMGNFLLIGIILGTAHIIQASGGKRSARWWTIIPMVVFTLLGVVYNSKQGIYEPLAVWVMCCALYRYKFNKPQIVWLIAAGIFSIMVVFPVVQYSRGFVREGALVNRALLVYDFMRDHSISDIRASYNSDEELREESGQSGYFFYYGKDAQLLDRVSLIAVDDAVVNYTLAKGTAGYGAFTQEFILMVPRVIFPNKDRYVTASIVNVLGRETGILGAGDETTFIAFSLFGPSFYMGGWWAVIVLTFGVMSVFFWLMDSFYGDARISVYALLAIAGTLHGAAEMILPVTAGVILHMCVLGPITLWLLRRLSVGAQVFIQRYSWYERSPDSLQAPRPFPQPRTLLFPERPVPRGLPI
jgi:hypothetical protein